MDVEFSPVTIGECCDITTGFPFKSASYIDKPEGIRLVRGDNIVQGSLRWDGVKRWDPEDLDEALEEKYSLKKDDVVLAMDRPWIEAGLKYSSIGRYDLPSLLVQRVARLRARSGVEQRLIKYIIASKAFTNHVLSIQTGTNVPHISSKQIAEYSFSLPPRADQEAIARILGTLDDKIELNRRTNETLEGIAKALFKSWFVDFDPVRAKAEGRPTGLPGEISKLFPDLFEESELGEIPNGWTICSVGELVEFQNGFAFKSSDWREEGVPVVKIGNVKPGIVDLSNVSYVSADVAAASDKYRLSIGDILIGMTGYVGEVGLVPIAVEMPLLNQRVGRLSPFKSDFREFVYCLSRSTDFKETVEQLSYGSAQANVSSKSICGIQIPLPTKELMSLFSASTEPLLSRFLCCHRESEILSSLRDSLLPRLISGELRVPDAEKMLEEVGV